MGEVDRHILLRYRASVKVPKERPRRATRKGKEHAARLVLRLVMI